MAHCPIVSIAGNVHIGKVAIQVIQLKINPTSFLTKFLNPSFKPLKPFSGGTEIEHWLEIG